MKHSLLIASFAAVAFWVTLPLHSLPPCDMRMEEKQPTAKTEGDEKADKKEEKTPSPYTFTANVSLVSDYRFRGISQTMRQPAIQGGFDLSHTSGLYVGTWGSNVAGTTTFYNNTCMEWDLYGGYKGKIFPCAIKDLTYNVGLLYYYYPGGKAHNPHNTRYNTLEFYVELAYKWISVKYWQTTTNYFGVCSNDPPTNWEDGKPDAPNGNSVGSNYIEGNINVDLLDKVTFRCLEAGKLSLLLHVGHQTVRHYGHLSYTDWKVTLTQEFAWFNLFLTYVGTNADHDYYDVPDDAYHPKKHSLGAQGAVVGIAKTF